MITLPIRLQINCINSIKFEYFHVFSEMDNDLNLWEVYASAALAKRAFSHTQPPFLCNYWLIIENFFIKKIG